MGPVRGYPNLYVGKRVQGHHPSGDYYERVAYATLDLMSTPLELVYPPLKSALSLLECATSMLSMLECSPMYIAQSPPGCAPLEVVVSGVGDICAIFRIVQYLVCNCGFYGVLVAVELCSIGKGRPTTVICHGVL